MHAEFVERFQAAWAASDPALHDALWSDDVELHQPVLGSLRWPAVDAFLLDDEGRILRRDSFWDPLPVLVHLLRHPSGWPRALRARMIPRLQDPDVPPLLG